MRSPMLGHLFDLEGNFVGSWAIEGPPKVPEEIRLAIPTSPMVLPGPVDETKMKIRRFRRVWRLFRSGQPIYEEVE